MSVPQNFDDVFEQNPYFDDIQELIEPLLSDARAAKDFPHSYHSFLEKVKGDIEVERRLLNSRIASVRLNALASDAPRELQHIITEHFDIAARRTLWSLVVPESSEAIYADFLQQQRRADIQHWEPVALAVGDATVEMILDGRVAYWTLAMEAWMKFVGGQHTSVVTNDVQPPAPGGHASTAVRPSAGGSMETIEQADLHALNIEMKRLNISAYRIQKECGPSLKTVQRLLRGTPVREGTFENVRAIVEKIANASPKSNRKPLMS